MNDIKRKSFTNVEYWKHTSIDGKTRAYETLFIENKHSPFLSPINVTLNDFVNNLVILKIMLNCIPLKIITEEQYRQLFRVIQPIYQQHMAVEDWEWIKTDDRYSGFLIEFYETILLTIKNIQYTSSSYYSKFNFKVGNPLSMSTLSEHIQAMEKKKLIIKESLLHSMIDIHDAFHKPHNLFIDTI